MVGDGRELYYWTDDALMVVPVETEPEFKPGMPKVLLKRNPVISYTIGSSGISWDVSPDGKRFLMIKSPSSGISSSGIAFAGDLRKINIVLNWFEELKQRVPLK